MTQWLLTTYFQAAGELYGSEIQRHVILSTYSAYPYTAAWYNRANTPQDPHILISGVWDGANRVLYSLCVIEYKRLSVIFSWKWLSILLCEPHLIIFFLFCLADAIIIIIGPNFWRDSA